MALCSAPYRRVGGHCHNRTMTAHRCAYCGVLANMEVVYSSSTRQIFSQKNRSRAALACDNCEELMVVVGETDADLGSTYSLDDEIEILSRYGLWLPHSSISYYFEHVPPRIARAAEEAHQAADAKANMAAVLMARTTVEATAKDKGIIKGTLFEKIDRLRDDGHIRRTIAQPPIRFATRQRHGSRRPRRRALRGRHPRRPHTDGHAPSRGLRSRGDHSKIIERRNG